MSSVAYSLDDILLQILFLLSQRKVAQHIFLKYGHIFYACKCRFYNTTEYFIVSFIPLEFKFCKIQAFNWILSNILITFYNGYGLKLTIQYDGGGGLSIAVTNDAHNEY